jgi:hypothetical protein
MLSQIQEMPFHIAFHVERISKRSRTKTGGAETVNYAVIVSRHEIVSHHKIEFPELLRTFNSNIFEFWFSLIQKWESISNLGSVYADVLVEGKQIRVFSVHLALWNPKTRIKEFTYLLDHVPPASPVVICGDFNVLEWGPVKILNWFLGSSFYEATPFYSEREIFENLFSDNKLINLHKSQITHAFSKSQLDHILVSQDFSVHKAWIESDSHGSDHHPIGAAIELL